jgi:hypothetical protein
LFCDGQIEAREVNLTSAAEGEEEEEGEEHLRVRTGYGGAQLGRQTGRRGI